MLQASPHEEMLRTGRSCRPDALPCRLTPCAGLPGHEQRGALLVYPFFSECRLAVDIQDIYRFGPRASIAAATGVLTPTLLSFALYSGVLGAGWKVGCP